MIRIVVSVTSLYGVILAHEVNNKFWIFCFGIITVLYNPIIYIKLSNEVWAIIGGIVAVLYIFSVLTINEKDIKEKDGFIKIL